MAVGIINGQLTTDTIKTVSNVTDLEATVAAASAGDIIIVAPGTYTLTSVTGPLVIPDGVTLKGSGKDQTIITEDGSLTNNKLVEMETTAVGTYNTAGVAVWGTTATTDTAAEAANVSEGDLLVHLEQTNWEYYLAEATADGVPGTGALAFWPPTPHVISNVATSAVTVYTSVPNNVVIEDLTLQGDGANTTHGVSMTACKNIIIRNVRIKDTLTDGVALTAPLNCIVDVEVLDATRGGVIGQTTGGDYKLFISCPGATPAEYVNTYNGAYDKWNVTMHGGVPTSGFSFPTSHNHRSRFQLVDSTNPGTASLRLNASDENITQTSARVAIQEAGGAAGNNNTST